MPNIKLPLLIQKRPLQILLHNKRPILPIHIPLPAPQPQLNIIQTRTHRYARPPIRKLARLHNPYILDRFTFVFGLLDLCVVFEEFGVLWIVDAFADVESQREIVEDVLVVELVVFAHRVEQGFFVADEEVGVEVVVDAQGVRGLDFYGVFGAEQGGPLGVYAVVEAVLEFLVFGVV